MADVFTKAKRSDVMSRIRSRGNERTELALVRVFRAKGVTGWRRHQRIRCDVQRQTPNAERSKLNIGRLKFFSVVPDFVFPKLRLAVADAPDGPFADLSPPFTPSWVEGPSAIRIGDDYIVYFDCYRDGHYGAVRSRDLTHWEDITSRVSFPKGARHGTVLRVPRRIIGGL